MLVHFSISKNNNNRVYGIEPETEEGLSVLTDKSPLLSQVDRNLTYGEDESLIESSGLSEAEKEYL
ncbi:hypothetical protein [Microcoleus phage My-WqHQDG]|nr:hypothetical protein [Microcoleus phage My-WqHQDG]